MTSFPLCVIMRVEAVASIFFMKNTLENAKLMVEVPFLDVEEWENEADCKGLDPEMFFSIVDEVKQNAMAICNACPVELECLKYALDVKEDYGIWGGMETGTRFKFRSKYLRQKRHAANGPRVREPRVRK